MIEILIHSRSCLSCPHFLSFVISKIWSKSRKINQIYTFKKVQNFPNFLQKNDKCLYNKKHSLHQLLLFLQDPDVHGFRLPIFLNSDSNHKTLSMIEWFQLLLLSIRLSRARVNHLKYIGYWQFKKILDDLQKVIHFLKV
jgi:hypothetical protein